MTIKIEEKYKSLLIHMISKVMEELIKKNVKIIDGNCIHFMIHEVVQKNPDLKKNIPFGWFYHGPYCHWIDDLLVSHFKMDKKYHQLEGKEPYNREFSNIVFNNKN